MKIFSGTSNLDFSKKVAEHLNHQLSKINISKFADGEINIVIDESIRKQDCYVIQPTSPSTHNSVNDNIIELFIICDALKRGSANSVNVIMPYYGYQRQDRKDYSRAPISAKVVASCLESLHIDRIIVFDLHAGQIQGFFSNKTPFDNLYVESEFIKYIRSKIGLDNVIIISPDEGGMKRAVRIATKLGIDSGAIHKERSGANQIRNMSLMGCVKDKTCIIVDDIIDTGGTCCKSSQLLKEKGAKNIYMFACHGVFSGNAFENIKNSHFDKIIVTNTIDHKRHEQKIKEMGIEKKIDIIDVSWMCSEAIRSAHYGESLSILYDS